MLLMLWVLPTTGQGLFESSIAEGSEETGGKALTIGGFIR